jgi:hypothetical protein
MNLTDYPTPITEAVAETRIVKGKPREIVDADKMRDLERQLAEAREAFSAQVEAWHEAVKQRDRLAEALRNLMAVIDSHDIQTEDCDRRGHLYCDCLHRARKPALEALAALNQPETKP